MSWQQSGGATSMSAIAAMSVACIGQGSAGGWTPAIPVRGSVRLSRKTRQSRRWRFMDGSLVLLGGVHNCRRTTRHSS
ncbi:hypothetical protein D3C85_1579010 [compost metagenome]